MVYLAVPALAGVSPADEFQTNTQGYLNVLEASRAAGVRRLSVTSSVAIYSNVAERPWREDADVSTVSTNPTEAYKKALEVLGLYFGQRTGLDVVMLRVAGHLRPAVPLDVQPAEPPGARRGARQAARLQRHARRAAQSRRRRRRVLRQGHGGWASSWRTPRRRSQHRIYNIGSGKVTRNAELVEAMRKVVPGFEAELPARRRRRPLHGPEPHPRARLQARHRRRHGLAEYVDWLGPTRNSRSAIAHRPGSVGTSPPLRGYVATSFPRTCRACRARRNPLAALPDCRPSAGRRGAGADARDEDVLERWLDLAHAGQPQASLREPAWLRPSG